MGSPLWQKKFRRFHKNQAVNLQQILIHGQGLTSFLHRDAVNFLKSRITTAFAAFARQCRQDDFAQGFAA